MFEPTTVSKRTAYDAIDAYVEGQRRRLKMPGVLLEIIEGDQIVHLRGFGRARSGGEAPMPQTPFFIGSLTKSFTALAVMQLVEAGKIDLDAPVQRYLPWFRVADPQASARMTVRHLLNQTSGLPTSSGEIPLADFNDSPGATERQARALSTLVLARPVGSAFEYSNSNYNLLGLIIEAAIGPYHIVDLPPARRVWRSVLDLSGPKHCMVGLLEVDVTVGRQFIAEHKAHTGETLSFTGFLAFCLARAVDEDKAVQAYLKGRRQLVMFDDVNVGLMVERKIGEKSAPMGHVIGGANRKTYREIHQEIRSVQSEPVPPSRGMPTWFRSAMLLPWPLSKLFNALLRMATRRDPTILISMAGTVGITAVGMFGKGHSG